MLCSFIIPAYNASNTIVRCLDSIYALVLDVADFEVIVIDDCSKDNTFALVEEYAQQYVNITLLRQSENHRQGAARNRGVATARGKYIVFVDSDDESDKGVVEALQLAEKNDLDMVAMHYINIDQYGNIIEKEPIILDGVFTGVEMQTKHPYWGTAPWSYIYRKSFLQQVDYPFTEEVLFEDSDFVIVHLYHAERMMYYVPLAYRMYYNASSTTHTTTYKHVADYVLLGTRMLNFYHSLEDNRSRFARSILEGGSYIIWIACKRLIKLQSVADVHAFYNRVDAFIDCSELLDYTEPRYCWTFWTKLCLKHRFIAMFLIAIGQLGYKLKQMIK